MSRSDLEKWKFSLTNEWNVWVNMSVVLSWSWLLETRTDLENKKFISNWKVRAVLSF